MSATVTEIQRIVRFDKPGFGKPRSLRFDINALCELEAELKMSIKEIFQERSGFLTVRGLLWAGLKWEERSLLPAKVGAMMNIFLSKHNGSLEDLMLPVGEAIKLSRLFPEPETEDEPPGDPDAIDVTEGNGTPPVITGQ